jgi:hypothetical protein
MRGHRETTLEYQSDYVLRLIEQMGAALRLATRRFAEGASADESLDATEDAIRAVVDIDPQLFVRMSPSSMAALLEISNLDDRLVTKLAEALLLQADILQSEADLVEAGVRREQAAAVLESVDPGRAN